MGNLYAPNGVLIVGTADVILATATITLGSVKKTETGFNLEWQGSDVHWDSQETRTKNGRLIYVDDDGAEWPEDQLEYRED